MKARTPSERLKKLYKDGLHHHTSLKDFIVNLGANGTHDEKRLVDDWFVNKTKTKK